MEDVVPRWIRLAPALTIAVTIFGLSSIPGRQLGWVFGWDKGWHFLEYGIFGASLAFGLRGRRHAWLIAAVVAALYGCTDELHQWFVPGRSADPRDALADAIGGTLGAVGWVRLFPRR